MPVPVPPPSRRPLIRIALGVAAAVLVLPAGASAAGTSWAGGGAKNSGPSRGTVLASVTVQGTTARVGIGAAGASCATGRIQRLTVQLPDPQAWSVIRGGRTITVSGGLRGRLRIAVNLTRNNPDALAGTVRLTGNLRAGRKRVTCRARFPVELRTGAPAARPGATNDTRRTGPTTERVSGGLAGSFVLRAVRPGRLTATWTSRSRCRTGSSTRTVVALNTLAGLRIRADGTLRRTLVRRTRSGGVRITTTLALRAALGSDGIVRGTVRAGEVRRTAGRATTTCSGRTNDFVASP